MPADVRQRLLGTPELAAKPRSKAKRPDLKKTAEDVFVLHCRAHKLPMFKREYLFAKDLGRLWRFDFAWPELHCALEVEGLVAMQARDGSTLAGGRHATFQGFEGDAVKYATAAILGWSVLRFNQRLVTNGTAIDMTKDLLKARGWKA